LVGADIEAATGPIEASVESELIAMQKIGAKGVPVFNGTSYGRIHARHVRLTEGRSLAGQEAL
jgi:hypothetical protein